MDRSEKVARGKRARQRPAEVSLAGAPGDPPSDSPEKAPGGEGLTRREAIGRGARASLAMGGAALAASSLGAGLSAIGLMACERKPPGQMASRRVHLLQWSHLQVRP